MILFLKNLRLNSVFRRGCSVEIPCASFKKHFAKKKKKWGSFILQCEFILNRKKQHRFVFFDFQGMLILLSSLSHKIQSFWLQTSKHTSNQSNWPTMRTLSFSPSLSQILYVWTHVFVRVPPHRFCTCVWGAAADHVSHTGLGSSSSSSSCAVTKEKPKGKARCILASSCFPFDHSPLCLCSIHLLLLVGEGILKVLHKNGQQYRSGAFTFVSF